MDIKCLTTTENVSLCLYTLKNKIKRILQDWLCVLLKGWKLINLIWFPSHVYSLCKKNDDFICLFEKDIGSRKMSSSSLTTYCPSALLKFDICSTFTKKVIKLRWLLSFISLSSDYSQKDSSSDKISECISKKISIVTVTLQQYTKIKFCLEKIHLEWLKVFLKIAKIICKEKLVTVF